MDDDFLPPANSKANLTGAGCIVTLLSAVVVFGLALPVVQWRDPDTGRRLPRILAIGAPVLAGACFHGLASFLLWLIRIPVWAKEPRNESIQSLRPGRPKASHDETDNAVRGERQ